MNCESIMASGFSAPTETNAAARFAELMNTCSQPGAQPPDEVYVAGPSRSQAQASSPVFGVLTQLQEFQTAPLAAGDAQETALSAADAILQSQQELLRTAIMMETMNSTKQGVSTLFQLQG